MSGKSKLGLFVHSNFFETGELARVVFLTDSVIETMIRYREVRWLRRAVGPLVNEIARLPLDEQALPQADRSNVKAREGGGIELSYYAEMGYQRIYSLVPLFAIPKQPDDEPDPPRGGGATMRVLFEPEIAVAPGPMLLRGFDARRTGGTSNNLGMIRLFEARVSIAMFRRVLARPHVLATGSIGWKIAAGRLATNTGCVSYTVGGLPAAGADLWVRVVHRSCIVSTVTSRVSEGQPDRTLPRFVSIPDDSILAVRVRDHRIHGARDANWCHLRSQIETLIIEASKNALRDHGNLDGSMASAVPKPVLERMKTGARTNKVGPVGYAHPIANICYGVIV